MLILGKVRDPDWTPKDGITPHSKCSNLFLRCESFIQFYQESKLEVNFTDYFGLSVFTSCILILLFCLCACACKKKVVLQAHQIEKRYIFIHLKLTNFHVIKGKDDMQIFPRVNHQFQVNLSNQLLACEKFHGPVVQISPLLLVRPCHLLAWSNEIYLVGIITMIICAIIMAFLFTEPPIFKLTHRQSKYYNIDITAKVRCLKKKIRFCF